MTTVVSGPAGVPDAVPAPHHHRTFPAAHLEVDSSGVSAAPRRNVSPPSPCEGDAYGVMSGDPQAAAASALKS